MQAAADKARPDSLPQCSGLETGSSRQTPQRHIFHIFVLFIANFIV